MKLFSWNGEIDTVLNPNDSIRYYKSILRAGLLSMDPNTGFVKAWVGGVDFKHFSYDHVKQSKRQVGSTIKPFVYSTALTMEVVKPCTRFDSGNPMCVEYGPGMSRRWCPRGNIPGNATVAMGLAVSSNAITAVVMEKMGGNAGPKNISKLLKSLEINLRPEDEVPSMCLGVMDLSLYQIVGAQSMFVNHGIYIRPTTILRIEDRNGNVIYSADPHSKEVLNSGIAYTTLTMMKGVVQFGTAGSLRSTRKWGGDSVSDGRQNRNHSKQCRRLVHGINSRSGYWYLGWGRRPRRSFPLDGLGSGSQNGTSYLWLLYATGIQRRHPKNIQRGFYPPTGI